MTADSGSEFVLCLTTNSLQDINKHISRNIEFINIISRWAIVDFLKNNSYPSRPVDQFLSTMQRGLTDMSIDIVRPCGQNAVLKVTLGRTLKAIIVLRGLLIEWVRF